MYGISNMFPMQMSKEVARLRKLNAELLDALKELVDFENYALMDDHVPTELIEKARRLIAKAEAE